MGVLTLQSQLEATQQELANLLYAISHDLRAPLRSIDGFSEALFEDHAASLDDEGRDYLQRIRGACRDLTDRLEALLMLSRLCQAPPRLEPVDVAALARKVAAGLASGEPARHVEWIFEDGPALSADVGLIETALRHLLDNAWKFTAPVTTPRIEVRPQGSHTWLVRDNGVGFNAERASRLFVPFQRFHRAGEFSGLGVGLAAASRIVAMHGGRIWAESAPGQGACFFFTMGETE
jgi:signal transduction histidine kinase